MNRELFYRGQKGTRWGIWDTARAEWISNIAEDTPMLAQARLYQLWGKKAKAPGLEPRQLPRKRAPKQAGLGWLTCGNCMRPNPAVWLGAPYTMYCASCGAELEVTPSVFWDFGATLTLTEETKAQYRRAGTASRR